MEQDVTTCSNHEKGLTISPLHDPVTRYKINYAGT